MFDDCCRNLRVEMMANNLTDDGSITGVGPLPRSLYTPTCRIYDFVMETILMGSLCLFGFAGNTLSMICLRRDMSRSATPLLLISLEISDTLFLSAVLVVRVISSFQVNCACHSRLLHTLYILFVSETTDALGHEIDTLNQIEQNFG